MNLYLISQDINNEYDTYDSAVVAANTEDEARNTHPCSYSPFKWVDGEWYYKHDCGYETKDRETWTSPDKVKVEYIGKAKSGTYAGVILSSFNAG